MAMKDAPTFHELPQSMRILVVDDEADILDRNMAALREALSPHVGDLTVFSADSAVGLFDAALSQMPEIIVLDDRYRDNFELWRLKEPQVEALAQKFGVDFNPIRKPDRGGSTMIGVMPDDLYFPSSTNFALLLRYFGYSGKIVVTSGDPPDPERIEKDRQEMNEHLAKSGTAPVNATVINGVATKSFKSHDQNWATGKSKWGGWDYHKIKDAPYSQSLNQLIRSV